MSYSGSTCSENQRAVIGKLMQRAERQPALLAMLDEAGYKGNFISDHRLAAILKEIRKNPGRADLIFLGNKFNEKYGATFLSGLLEGISAGDGQFLTWAKNAKIEFLQDQGNKLAVRYAADPQNPALWKLARPILEGLDELEHGKAEARPVLVKMEDVEPEGLQWLWWNRFPMGKLSLVVGDPATGKSFFALFMAARVSRGDAWPDIDQPAPELARSVIILSAEDDIADTIRPRLDAAGADLSKIFIMKGISRSGKKEIDPFDVKNIDTLTEALRSIKDQRLIILDPITEYQGDIDGNATLAVRRSLQPLRRFAAENKIAVIAISHLNKTTAMRAIYRTTGSTAYTAAARAVWAISKDKDDPERRILAPLKCNLSINPTSLAFRIVEGATEFERDPIDVSADDILSDEDAGDRTLAQDAQEWLRDLLADGPIEVAQILKSGRDNGFSEKTIRRARACMKIAKRKQGFGTDGKWFWGLK